MIEYRYNRALRERLDALRTELLRAAHHVDHALREPCPSNLASAIDQVGWARLEIKRFDEEKRVGKLTAVSVDPKTMKFARRNR